ncbi:hypothetical protein [Pseudonocardia sp. ICBG1034]|uniref:hypothetical protein n=1 Tax=Pseudonocardia sp. ICBG1034 TaxID=2844381 RepID=UPI001CCD794E|nr:hypothetical protein [Pseudonocardia sp. ICBG1034]
MLPDDGHRCTATVVSSSSGGVAVIAERCAHADGHWGEGSAFAPAAATETPASVPGLWERTWFPPPGSDGGLRTGDNGELIDLEHDLAFLPRPAG